MQAFSQKSYNVTQKMPNESLHWRENEDFDEKTRERRYFAAAAEACKTNV